MHTKAQIELPLERLEGLCRKWHIQELALFGSVLREDFRPDSDIDVLVTFVAGSKPNLVELTELEHELETLLGRKVDLVERRLIEESPNYIRRRQILESAEVIYGTSAG